MHKKKGELFQKVATFTNTDASLHLLEIGCGTRVNFKFYSYGCTMICTDPNLHFQKYLEMSIYTNIHLTYGKFLVVSGENMKEVKDESMDVVLLCPLFCPQQD